MKNIAVLIPSFTIEYSIDILNGIYDYFNEKDVRVIIAHTKYPHSTVSPFDYQYWTNIEYLKAKDIDGYIIVSGLYTSMITPEDFESLLEGLSPRPIVSIGVESKRENVYSIKSDCNKIYSDIIGHLKNNHNSKKIAFFSANSSGSEEALARFEAFKQALQEYDLPFDENLVFDGHFTEFYAEEEMSNRYKSKSEVNFDTVVCANDLMAIGCVNYLKKLGVKIPEEVKVVGFDDAIVARISSPKLSTINQNITAQGYKAAEIIDNILNDKKPEKNSLVSLKAKYRQSCGCLACNNHNHVYIDETGNEILESHDGIQDSIQFFTDMNEKNNLISLIDTLRCSNTLKQFFFNLRYIADQCDMPEVYINFFKEMMYLDSEDDFELPDLIELAMYSDLPANIHVFSPETTYNPRESFFAARTFQNKAGIYITHPIFSGSSNYGLMFCKIKNKNFADYIVHLKIIVNSIAQSYDYTNQITQTETLKTANSALKLQSRTDELTSILNRRGFIEQGQAALDLMQETDKAGVIFFADMDGLKTINDKYGHEMGDKAIKLQAEVLKTAFRSTDIVGRLSGDEFGAVAVGMNLSQVKQIKLKVQLLSEKISKDNDLPFILSCSIGAVDLQKSSVLKRLLSEADKELYEEKRKKRNARLSENTK